MSNKIATTKVDNLIAECRKFVPLDGRVLVHALKIRQVKQEDYSFDLADTKANEGKDPSKHRVDLKKIQPKINAKYQEAIVLQVPFDENRFKPGDTVVYPIGAINPFDLVKGVSMLRKYDIACVITNNDIDDDKRELVETKRTLGDIMAERSTLVSGYTV
jgi:hypothetical protein